MKIWLIYLFLLIFLIISIILIYVCIIRNKSYYIKKSLEQLISKKQNQSKLSNFCNLIRKKIKL